MINYQPNYNESSKKVRLFDNDRIAYNWQQSDGA